jgi:hypothetical protein
VKNDSTALKRTRQCLGNFRIQKWQEDIAPVDDVDLGAKRAAMVALAVLIEGSYRLASRELRIRG